VNDPLDDAVGFQLAQLLREHFCEIFGIARSRSE